MSKTKEKSKNENKKRIILVTVTIILLLLLIISISYAVQNFNILTGESKISTESTSIEFLESTNVISLENALPTSDKEGIAQSNAFNFVVTTKTQKEINLKYNLNIEKLTTTSGYTSLEDKDIKVYLTDQNDNKILGPTKISSLKNYSLYSKTNSHNKNNQIVKDKYKIRIWLDKDVDVSNWNKDTKYEYKFKINVNDKSGANSPTLTDNMIPVYYDEASDTWKKADVNNRKSTYKWYDYDNKMWANAVTVTSTNRSKYLSANAGTEIPMSDINTMWVWIPRYTYTYLNTNTPEEIKIKFEEGTSSSGTISCTDTATGTSSTSETCTDSTNGSVTAGTSTYTHPAFWWDKDDDNVRESGEELTGIWVGKFEIGNSQIIKPNVTSWREASVSTLHNGIYSMRSNGNNFGFKATDETHMMKNMEWGAVTYLYHSKYGRCTDGTCSEVSINNSSGFYTGRSGGSPNASESTEGTYKYNETSITTTTISGGTEVSKTVANDTTYPWTSSDGLYRSSNQGKDSTTTSLSFDFTAPSDKTYLSFDLSVSSESASYDYLYYTITKDGTTLSDTGTSTKIGGTGLGTTESALTYKSVSRRLEQGTYKLTFTYIKDGSDADGTDTGYVKNIKIVDNPTTVKEEKTPIGEGKDGPSASTTGNVYGIYDMSGGAYEYMMGDMISSTGVMMSGYQTSSNLHSGFTGYLYSGGDYTGTYDFPNKRYYDKYSYGTSQTEYTRGKLGDATKEMAPSSSSYTTWYSDLAHFPSSIGPWFERGGCYNDDGSDAGLFYFNRGHGNARDDDSARAVVFGALD